MDEGTVRTAKMLDVDVDEDTPRVLHAIQFDQN
jgi:hypothetical protein